ncbi:MAG: ATP-binding cassette domain-containing protein [Bacteroidota bacterium]
MKITFHEVMPVPLAHLEHQDESIWGAQFALEQGEKIMLNATSGKGKTTFTHLLSGLRNDYKGTICFDDQDISRLSTSDWSTWRREKIAFVYQDLQLFPKLTVKENLVLKNNLTHTFSEKTIKELLAALEIEKKWETPCEILSMGQQQRVAIIRALAQPFDWLVMDEPFSHLDTANASRALELIDRRCAELNAGFVLTSLGDQHEYNYDRELKL